MRGHWFDIKTDKWMGVLAESGQVRDVLSEAESALGQVAVTGLAAIEKATELLNSVAGPGSILWDEPVGGPDDDVDWYALTPDRLNRYARLCECAAIARSAHVGVDAEAWRLLDEAYVASRIAKNTIISLDLDEREMRHEALGRMRRIVADWPLDRFPGCSIPTLWLADGTGV